MHQLGHLISTDAVCEGVLLSCWRKVEDRLTKYFEAARNGLRMPVPRRYDTKDDISFVY
jgi:hypothetical protein